MRTIGWLDGMTSCRLLRSASHATATFKSPKSSSIVASFESDNRNRKVEAKCEVEEKLVQCLGDKLIGHVIRKRECPKMQQFLCEKDQMNQDVLMKLALKMKSLCPRKPSLSLPPASPPSPEAPCRPPSASPGAWPVIASRGAKSCGN